MKCVPVGVDEGGVRRLLVAIAAGVALGGKGPFLGRAGEGVALQRGGGGLLFRGLGHG